MAKKNEETPNLNLTKENISIEPLEEVMGDRYATYAKYVIQDRAIPDVRDGLKPVQRRIIFSMYENGNTINKPTKKCAHTVGAVMGTYHPHGDTSIYEALARMSQDWKLRYPLIDFQGNNGSIDGDGPAAYRYTESRLSEISNELIRDIDSNTVDMQFNFDDTKLEPTVLPSRFPNLFCNGSEGIAVALATEIPPHNLKEMIDAIVYRISHKNVSVADLRQFVLGPDFPGGGIIYRSNGLDNIYETGRGRIEIASKCEFVTQKDMQQIVISELPYKCVKKLTVFEIDKIIHSKAISGMIEVRDESDWTGIRVVIDCKKDAKVDLIWQYLLEKTSLKTNYSTNMVAIVDSRPKTLNLLDYIDAYIAHQVNVFTRKCKFDLEKYSARLHIVDGLIIASININEVVDIIKKSKDKADSKINLMARFSLSNEQAEAIAMMPLYKLSHSDELVLQQEKKQLEDSINYINELLNDENKFNRALIKDLKSLANKYGDERRTQIVDKIEAKPIDKRDLIAKEETMFALTYDGYVKRSSIKSYRTSDSLPGIKDGDSLVSYGQAYTTDYLICFTNKGNYVCLPVHKLTENRWKDEGIHINTYSTLEQGEKIIKAFILDKIRNDLYFVFLTSFGQIKRISVGQIETAKRSRPVRAMRLLSDDTIVGVELTTGESDLLVITNNGYAVRYNENYLAQGSSKAINLSGNYHVAALVAFEVNDKSRVVIITDKGHQRTIDSLKCKVEKRSSKPIQILQSFKNDVHKIVSAVKVGDRDLILLNLYLNDQSSNMISISDFRANDALNAKKNIQIPGKAIIRYAFDNSNVVVIDDKIKSYPLRIKEKPMKAINEENNQTDTNVIVDNSGDNYDSEPSSNSSNDEEDKKEHGGFEQISIFDDLDD